jgi:predicted HTH transcriptional regulator
MDADTLARLLREGKSQTTEFVLTLPSDKLAARVLTAFANTDGGGGCR